ncbi:uncharacterized protein FFB14_10825 [Fusarium fujikuroi]|nr:uncharacterized protein FFB14_10825 [Fusarium fujikuroi]
MDPASLSFGIVSLAMQLVQTAKAVKEHIAAYKSAAKELESLADKLDDIETICCSLEIILSDGTQNSSSLEVNLLKKLSRIIQQCLSQVSDIHSILDTISRMQKNTRNPLKTIGPLFLRHRDQIRFATNGLDRCLSSLQLHMTANILAVTMTSQKAVRGPLPTTTTSPSTVRDLRKTPSVRRNPDQSDKHHARRKSPETVVDTWRQAWNTKAFVQWTRKTTKEEVSVNTNSSIIQDDSIFTIGSSMLSLYVKLSLRRGSLAPFCITLQIPRVIYIQEGQRQIGEKVESAFMDDNLSQIKTYFTQGILTPTTVIAWDEYDPDNETSLLGLAALTKSQSILKFLATQTFDLSSRGLDIDQQLRCDTDFSVLKDILFYNWDTDEILEQIHLWIDILEEAGISIKEYLMVETECCFATWRDTPYWINKKVYSSNYRRVLFIKESRGRQFPFWALSIHDECPVKELLTEHEHFATPLTMYPGGSTQAFIAQHEAWKKYQALGLLDGSDRCLKRWPFWLPLRYYNDYSEEEAEWVDRELQVAGKRFDRKQKRKERKAGRCWQK